MAKEELIQFEGLVTEILPDARYRVQLDAGHEIVAYTAGKMKKNRIKTLAGRIKKSCTSGLFWTLLSNNIVHRFSAGRH